VIDEEDIRTAHRPMVRKEKEKKETEITFFLFLLFSLPFLSFLLLFLLLLQKKNRRIDFPELKKTIVRST